jgi:TolB protein
MLATALALLVAAVAGCGGAASLFAAEMSGKTPDASVAPPDSAEPPNSGGDGATTPNLGACIDTVVSGDNDLSHVQGGVIAFTLRDAQGQLQIFTAKPDGSELRQLTAEGQNGLAAWSRDGKQLAFMAIRVNGAFIGVMNADGSNQRLFAAGGQAPDWFPDGRLIAFSRDGQIWTMNADGTGEKRITSSGTFKVRPSWSPDGTQIVFILIRNPNNPMDPQPQIGIMSSGGTSERILTAADRTNVCIEIDGSTRVLETAHDANAPSWSPVDDRIAFWSGIENMYGQVWSIRADGTASTQLTHETRHSNNDDPSWSPDGTKILFSTGRSGRNELWVMDADGSNEMRLFPIEANPFPGRGAWQPISRRPRQVGWR